MMWTKTLFHRLKASVKLNISKNCVSIMPVLNDIHYFSRFSHLLVTGVFLFELFGLILQKTAIRSIALKNITIFIKKFILVVALGWSASQ